MTTDELAQEVESFIVHAVTRVREPGEQYSHGDTQNFETLEIDKVFEWAEEELIDIVNYAVMLTIRLRRLRAEIAETIEGVAHGLDK